MLLRFLLFLRFIAAGRQAAGLRNVRQYHLII